MRVGGGRCVSLEDGGLWDGFFDAADKPAGIDLVLSESLQEEGDRSGNGEFPFLPAADLARINTGHPSYVYHAELLLFAISDEIVAGHGSVAFGTGGFSFDDCLDAEAQGGQDQVEDEAHGLEVPLIGHRVCDALVGGAADFPAINARR